MQELTRMKLIYQSTVLKMKNRYYIVKVKSVHHSDKWMYAFKDSFSTNGSEFFMVEDNIFFIECPSDAISVCMLMNNNF